MRVALLSILAWTQIAQAHGPSGSHDSPQWCGDRVATLADGGVLLGATLVKLPVAQALVAWSPTCDQIAVVGDKAWLIDTGTRAVRELGALPGGYQRAMRMDGPAPSVRWSPSGKAFAVVAVNATINDETIVRFDAATGKGVVLKVTGEIKAFAMLDDDAAVVAVRAPGAPQVNLVRATEAGAKPVTRTAYKDARISITPIVVGLHTMKEELVIVDPIAGSEQVRAAKIQYLQAMSADGSHALALIQDRLTAIDASGSATTFDGELSYGLVADEHTGWSTDGTLTIARVTKGWGISAIGAKLRAWTGLPKGTIEHVSIAPDGKRAAFIVEVPERGTRKPGCDFEAWTRADLYIAQLVGAPRPKKIATVAHLHACGVE